MFYEVEASKGKGGQKEISAMVVLNASESRWFGRLGAPLLGGR